MSEASSNLPWYPERGWDARRARQGQLQRIYGLTPDAWAVGWTQAFFPRRGAATYTLRGRTHGPLSVVVADREIFRTEKAGAISAQVTRKKMFIMNTRSTSAVMSKRASSTPSTACW